jgi:hydroxyacylglutathione hydrolase
MDIISKEDLTVHQINTSCLAQFSYIIHSGTNLIIIDPLRDTKIYTDYINNKFPNGPESIKILETHFHADFVSGHRNLAQLLGATIVYGPNGTEDGCQIA